MLRQWKFANLIPQYLGITCDNELSISSLSSELILFNVHVEASGEWECVVSTGRGNTSRSVEIVVLENSASFCPEDKVVNNRGEFRLVTVTLFIVTYLRHSVLSLFSGVNPQVAKNSGRHHLPSVLLAAALPIPVCRGGYRAEKGLSLLWPLWKVAGGWLLQLSLHKRNHPRASYLHPGQSCCQWKVYHSKHYVDLISRCHTWCPHNCLALVFQRPINASNAVTVAHQVRTYTLEAAGFTDSVDVLYVAQMMEKFMEYVKQLQEVRKF